MICQDLKYYRNIFSIINIEVLAWKYGKQWDGDIIKLHDYDTVISTLYYDHLSVLSGHNNNIFNNHFYNKTTSK